MTDKPVEFRPEREKMKSEPLKDKGRMTDQTTIKGTFYIESDIIEAVEWLKEEIIRNNEEPSYYREGIYDLIDKAFQDVLEKQKTNDKDFRHQKGD